MMPWSTPWILYVSPDLPREKVSIVPPAIDPLNPKNMPLSMDFCRKIVSWVGVDTNRPLVTQVSRFDPWKDPLGVVEGLSDGQGSMCRACSSPSWDILAADDPEGQVIYRQVQMATRDEPDIYLFTNFTAASSVEVNAFQHYSDVVIQKSIKEGFGLVVAEALWKGTPVVAGSVGGIPLQVQNGKGGFLVNSIEECAEKVLYLLQNPAVAKRMGLKGRQHIRSNYLTPRLLSDELKILRSLN